jgi:DNA-directed RNA polymerase subunit RPC12/RpoP
MVKIIKYGKIPEPKQTLYKAECKRCGTIFEFEEKESENGGGFKYIRNRQFYIKPYLSINCPYCNNIIYIGIK